ncbi:MAG: 3-deoxy-8-phosphooctulonate synthase, partial [Endomicrobiales bacterium]
MTIRLGRSGVAFANSSRLVLIAGPCVIESERMALETAARLKDIAGQLEIPLVFKASYDKANRSSLGSYRGPGLEKGLRVLAKVKAKTGLPVLTDVHCAAEVSEAAQVADVLQVPAFLCRQTDLLVACGRTGLPVNVKKAQFLAPEDTANIAAKLESTGNRKILLTERGTSFGYRNLVVDMRSLPIMKGSGYPVIFDATHSVQLPGAKGSSTGGQREFISPLARAAAAVGIAG